MYIRARILIESSAQAEDFVKNLNSDGTVNKYHIEDASGSYKVNARSMLGVMYASAEFSNEMYLVNDTEDGVFPSFVNSYRVM